MYRVTVMLSCIGLGLGLVLSWSYLNLLLVLSWCRRVLSCLGLVLVLDY
jgi:hypothetical protein